MATVAEALQLAIQARDAGQIKSAEQICRQILAVDPRCANAWHLLGVINFQTGDHTGAVEHIGRAVQLVPSFALAHNNLGNALMALGRRPQAITAFRRAAELDTNNLDALRNLGYALKLAGDLDASEAAFQQAAQRGPKDARAQLDLGQILLAQGNHHAAADAFARAIALDNRLVDAHLGSGSAALAMGDVDRAIAAYEYCLKLQPDYSSALNNLANAWLAKGDRDRAIDCFKSALAADPNSCDVLNNLGNALLESGDTQTAIAHYQKVILLRPDYAAAYSNLGNAFKSLNRPEAAVDAHKKALALKPDFAQAHFNLASVLRDIGRIGEAEAACRRAIELQPDYADAMIGLANLLRDQARFGEAREAYNHALLLKPNDAKSLANSLLMLHYEPGVTLESLRLAHSEYETKYASRFRESWIAPKPRPAGKKLRVGFVSPDFGLHPVGFLLVRGFEHFDRNQFEVACYCDRPIPDEVTERFRRASNLFHDTRGWSDERVAAQIRADGIDILYDLAGHTAHSRMLVFARKPAPIQASWLGYEGSTGLAAIDYILGDRHVIPPESEKHYPERVLRFPDIYVCYDPPTSAPAVEALPALSSEVFTFGCFNNPAKLNDTVIGSWADILRRVPRSRLFLKYRGLDDAAQKTRLTAQFSHLDIDADRLVFEGKSSHVEYLASYGRVDLALDPFPFCGGVTTCEALWMGVPVLTCPGQTFAGRHSLSFLSAIGLTQWIAPDVSTYIDRAVAWSHDLPRLAELRQTLRAKMAASPLCDGPRFARAFLELQRQIIA